MKSLHAWDLSPKEAVDVQTTLRDHLQLTWDEGQHVPTVGGADIGISGESARCAIVLVRFPELSPFEAVTAEVPLVFPYIPGLLAFPEGPGCAGMG